MNYNQKYLKYKYKYYTLKKIKNILPLNNCSLNNCSLNNVNYYFRNYNILICTK